MVFRTKATIVVAVLVLLSFGVGVATYFDYPVPPNLIIPYTKTTMKRWMARETDPIDVSLLYLTRVLSGNVEDVARLVVSEGEEEVLRQARENRTYFEAYGLAIKLIRFDPISVNILSPAEVVFGTNVQLLVSSPYWTELETFRWNVALVREGEQWKVASAEVFDRETDIVRIKL